MSDQLTELEMVKCLVHAVRDTPPTQFPVELPGAIIAVIERLEAENKRLIDRMQDYDDACKNAQGERCDANEKHCTCVGLLRTKIKEQAADNKRLREALGKTDGMGQGVSTACLHCTKIKGPHAPDCIWLECRKGSE